MIRASALAGLIVLALPVSSARADNGSLAEALFRDARQAMRDGRYAEACPKLAESQRLDPSAGTRLNLALCEEHEGRVATAWGHFHAVTDELPAADSRVAIAREHAAALEPKLPWLRIVMPPDAGEASVDVDGTVLRRASLEAELPVDPGTHVLTMHVATHVHAQNVAVALGEHASVTLDLAWIPPEPAQARHESAPPPQPASSHARETAGWITVATGAAGLAASFVLGGLVLHEKSVVQTHCPNKQCDPTGLSAGRTGTTLEKAGTVSFAAGAVGVGLGTFLVVGAPSRPLPPARGAFFTLHGSF